MSMLPFQANINILQEELREGGHDASSVVTHQPTITPFVCGRELLLDRKNIGLHTEVTDNSFSG